MCYPFCVHRLLPLLIASLCALTDALAAVPAPRLGVETQRFESTCGPGTALRAIRLGNDLLTLRAGAEQTTWQLDCATPDGVAHGPALRVRHSFRHTERRLLQRRWFLASQLVWAGRYDAGERDGVWRQFNARGEELGRNGLDHGNGRWHVWRGDGTLAAAGTLVDDRRHGVWRFMHPSGVLAETGSFTAGQPEGRWRRWYANGGARSDISYLRGQRDGLTTEWHATGEKRREGHFTGGKRHGAWSYWNARGDLLGVNMFEHGSGRETAWHDSGEKREDGLVKDGRRFGYWARYDASGRKVEDGEYTNDHRVAASWKHYDRDGKVTRGGANRRVALARLGIGSRINLLGGGGIAGGSGVGGGLTIRGYGQAGLGARRSAVGKSPMPLPEVRVTVHAPADAQPTANAVRGLQMTLRMCSIAFEIRRMRGALGRSQPAARTTDSARLEVGISSVGRVTTVRIVRHAARMDSAWHRCITTAARLLRLPPTAAVAGLIPVDIDVR